MSDSKKLFSARETAQAVLNKAKEILQESSLMKAEKLKKDGNTLGAAIGYPGAAQNAPSPSPSPNPMPKSEMKKYETENRKAPPSVKYGKIEKDVKPVERDWNEYEVKSGNSKDSSGPRLARQVSPSGNPKEEAEGNNAPNGMEPPYEFKDKVAKELAKEKASHGMEKTESKHDRCVKDVERNSPGVKNAHAVCVAEGVKPAKWKKSENPDKEADAELGEKVEHDVEEHMLENKDAEQQEGHELMNKPGDKSEGQTESNIIPRLIGSAKLSKFMEHMHSKRKHREAQGAKAVGQEASDAPENRSHQDSKPNLEKKYEGFKAVEESAKESGARNPSAVAAAVGREKYGKEAFQHAAAAGKKMGHK